MIKSYFGDNESQNYLIFLQVFRYFQILSAAIDKFFGWKLKKFPEESIRTPATSDKNFASKLAHIHNLKIIVKFKENYLKQDKVSFKHRNVANFLLFMN